VISETAQIGGFPVTLLDTAGIAPSENPIEQLGIERSRQALRASAAALFVLDGTTTPTPEDIAVAQALSDRIGIATDGTGAQLPVVVAVNKRDLGEPQPQDAALRYLAGCAVVAVSAVTGEGIAELESALATVIAGPAGSVQPTLLTTRQQAALERARDHLQEAEAARQAGYPLDLLSVDIRAALHDIGSVTGEAVDDAVLNEIFSRFCIGK
jgi:tRNA modification GTPase